MAIQVRAMSFHCLSFLPRIKKISKEYAAAFPTLLYISRRRTIRSVVRSSADSSSSSSRWEFLKQLPTPIPCLSDVLWPSAGAFAAMAILGRLDQLWAHKGLSFTIAPIGAVCAVLFAAPNSPAAQKYNMFVAQIGCAAIGVLALSIFGPGWLARATALAASIAFMTVTGSIHPPAASLPILFIDGAKFHHLNLWYALFPGATVCLLLCLIQEVVTFLKSNYRGSALLVKLLKAGLDCLRRLVSKPREMEDSESKRKGKNPRSVLRFVLILANLSLGCTMEDKCSACNTIAGEIQIGLSNEKPRNHLDMRHRLDSKGQREGKVIDYRVSDLRVVELLDGLCEKMQDYTLEKLDTGEEIWVRVNDWDNLSADKDKQEARAYSKYISSFCARLLEETEDELAESIKKGDLKPEQLSKVLCQDLSKHCVAHRDDDGLMDDEL